MSDARALSAIVLAAGEGTRMRSSLPKPLHPLCGREMILHVLDALGGCSVSQVVVVVGHGGDQVTKKVEEDGLALPVDFVEQHVQRGTGDAVSVGLTAVEDDPDEGDVLVLPGDTPLLRPETVAALLARHRETDAACTLLTASLSDPTGYGRVLRGRDERVRAIVEEADASEAEREIEEVNTSIYCFRRSVLAPALRRLSPENAQGEYYLTDVVQVLHDAGYGVVSLVADDPAETQGVNDRSQLSAAEAVLRSRTNERWLARGVTMVDPDRTYLDATVELATDVTLLPGTILQGRCVVGPGAELGPDTRLVDCTVGEGARLEVVVGRRAEVGARAQVGPFVVLEPGSVVPADAVLPALYTAAGG